MVWIGIIYQQLCKCHYFSTIYVMTTMFFSIFMCFSIFDEWLNVTSFPILCIRDWSIWYTDWLMHVWTNMPEVDPITKFPHESPLCNSYTIWLFSTFGKIECWLWYSFIINKGLTNSVIFISISRLSNIWLFLLKVFITNKTKSSP